MKVIVGLGNPGRKYAGTRHNIGFMTLDTLADRLGKPDYKKKTLSFIREDYSSIHGDIMLIKPLMYMNLSGEALSRTGLNWDSAIDDTIVIYDESAIEFGRIRIRKNGSAGGHKGMKNIIDVMKTDKIARIRLGIGKDPDMDLKDYVLKPFFADERKELPSFLDRAADAVETCIEDGIDKAMSVFNAPPAE